jgi:hypothetical protein
MRLAEAIMLVTGIFAQIPSFPVELTIACGVYQNSNNAQIRTMQTHTRFNSDVNQLQKQNAKQLRLGRAPN